MVNISPIYGEVGDGLYLHDGPHGPLFCDPDSAGHDVSDQAVHVLGDH